MGSGWPGAGRRARADSELLVVQGKAWPFAGYHLSLIGAEIFAELLLVREGSVGGFNRGELEQQVRNLVVMYEGAVLDYSTGYPSSWGTDDGPRSRTRCAADLVAGAIAIGMLRRRPMRVRGDEVRAWLGACKLALSRED